jgi:hypothetical protein
VNFASSEALDSGVRIFFFFFLELPGVSWPFDPGV